MNFREIFFYLKYPITYVRVVGSYVILVQDAYVLCLVLLVSASVRGINFTIMLHLAELKQFIPFLRSIVYINYYLRKVWFFFVVFLGSSETTYCILCSN